MSDSDSYDLLANNVFTFPNESTMVSAKGPNTNMNNITGLSFRNTVFSSTLQMPRPYERQRDAESAYDQWSFSNRREVSPMSVRSACDMRPRNFNYSFNPQGMGAPRSLFNSRSGSPMSVRSMGTSASTCGSAIDIAQAIKNKQFNKHELKIIKEACNKYVGKKTRKKFKKKERRRKCGYDSGEQGSNSSISSNDRSVATSNYKDNMSGCRSTITDISNFKRKIIGSNMLKDCTDFFKHNSIQNGAGSQMNWNNTQTSISSHRSMLAGPNISSIRNMPVPANFNNIPEKLAAPVMLPKYRFKSGYLPMSQRFNRSQMPTSIPENIERELHSEINTQNGQKTMNKNSRRNTETDSDEDNIFSNATKQKPTNNTNRKRSIDNDDIVLPKQKRPKILSPCKNSIEAQKLKVSNDIANDFIFAKPMCPARKFVKEKLISKSAAPLSDTIPQVSVPLEIQLSRQEKTVEEQTETLEDETSNSTCNSTNVSMRPSFIKRKLFTQKLDVSEKRNLSVDNLNSPQNSMYGAIQKEKHKARKLQQVTTQSCLNRDIQQDESNLLDLINKIVPIDQMNVTNQTNGTGSQSKNMTEEDNDKWDVTPAISTRKDDDDASDTYTDEEILNSTVKELQKNNAKEHTKGRDKLKKNTPKKPSPAKPKNRETLLEKLPTMIVGSKQSRIISFWETDFESDAEYQPSPRVNKLNSKENQRPDIVRPKDAPKTQDFFERFSSKKSFATSISSSQNFTFDTTQTFNGTLRIRSHRAPKRNKLDRTIEANLKSAVFNKESEHKRNQTTISTEISNPVTEAITKIDSNKSKETANKKDNKKSPKGKKQASKKDKQNQTIQKSNNKKQCNTKNIDQTKHNEIHTAKAQQKLISNSKKQDVVENIAQTNKLTNNKEKLAEPKVPNKSHKTKNTIQNSVQSPDVEENNKSNRPIRSCRTNSKKQTADKSNVTQNESMNRTLRPRNLNVSTTTDENNTKAGQKDTEKVTTANRKNTKAEQKDIEKVLAIRLSDVSFSLHKQKNAVAKKTVKKIVNSRLLNLEESDVSFSLTPIPRRTRSASRNNTLNSTPLRRNPSKIKELPGSNIKPNRNRLPNKRYVY